MNDLMDNDAAKQKLAEYLLANGKNPEYIEEQIRDLFATGGFKSRFLYMDEHFSTAQKENVLISGASVGTELILALEFGYSQVHGTEVEPELVEICQARFANNDAIHPIHYDGTTLPYADNTFTAIMSGHIIEHTRCPQSYIKEHMRVLQPGGRFFLEFPDRYHPIELHTGMRSYEKLPLALRQPWLWFLASPLSFLPPQSRAAYRSIRDTLRPISLQLIEQWLHNTPGTHQIIHHYEPAPGFVRMIIAKES